MATVNSKGLEKILSMDKSDQFSEYIDRETGILTESALSLKSELIKGITVEEIEELLVQAHQDLNEVGITGVHSADFSTLPAGSWRKVISAYKSLEEKDQLRVRTYQQCMFNDIDLIEEFIEEGYKTGDGSNLF
jgi:predicted amidohydrolase YtcJ